MTEVEYLSCEDPARLLASLTQGLHGLPADYCRRPSDSKLRLWVEACRERFTPDSCRPYPWPDLEKHPDQLAGCVRQWASPTQAHVLPLADRAVLLREVIGNPFRPVILTSGLQSCQLPDCGICCPWLTPTVFSIARQIYESGDFEGMGVLADALEDAGCDSGDLLLHLRGKELCPRCAGVGRGVFGPGAAGGQVCPECKLTTLDEWHRPRGCGFIDLRGPHVRGCWAVELILGKS